MGERKVVTKYIPPDFDPSLVPRGKKLSSKDGTVPVRMMLPFSIQCTTCHTFLYRGRKFNSKKEPMGGPAGVYLGITRWRFYIKCTQCSRTLTFCTDPQNADYEMESGGTRNYEYTAERKNLEQDAVTETEKAIKEDPLKALETRVLDSQREMADLDNLEEIRAMNARHVQILKGRPGGDKPDDDYFGADTEAVLRIRHGQESADNVNSMTPDGLLTEQDEALIASIQFGTKKAALTNSIRRLDEEDERRAEEQRKLEATRLMERRQQELERQQQQLSKPKIIPIIKAKRKRTTTTEAVVEEDQEGVNSKKANVEATTTTNATKVEQQQQPNGNLASLLGGYSSDSDSS